MTNDTILSNTLHSAAAALRAPMTYRFTARARLVRSDSGEADTLAFCRGSHLHPEATCYDCSTIAIGDPFLARLLVDLLAACEPLAALLAEHADGAAVCGATEVRLGPDAAYDTGVLDHRGELLAEFTRALAVARAIGGGRRA
ncbi:hypothetical protein AB0395_21850 [Streptosporangium sp. NPDC051023]|uniref:hypothetical protein n=1 Tax=Streptosporangium sp. NPDC051023 TaxID=3155410 RepID=UPI00344CAF21